MNFSTTCIPLPHIWLSFSLNFNPCLGKHLRCHQDAHWFLRTVAAWTPNDHFPS